jgi:cyclase
VSEGIFAYVQPDGSWWLNNTGFIPGRHGTLAIDTCGTEARTRAFLSTVEARADQPVRMLVNTHAHGDHTHGNASTLPAAVILGHERCREVIIDSGVASPVIKAVFPGVEWGVLEPAPPFVTFTDRMRLYVDDLAVELIHLGPAHTDNDVVAWLPERRVLFAGDLCFNGGQPNHVGGSIAGAIEAVAALRALEPTVIVPGHGGICGLEVLDDMDGYLSFVQRLAVEAIDAGVAPLDAARDTDAGRFADWLDEERLVGNLHLAMAEARGEKGVDLGAAFGDMMTFHGGPLRCLA